MVDVTPRIGADAKVIQSYSDKGFRISGVDYPSAVILSGAAAQAVPVGMVADLAPEHFAPLEGEEVSYLVLGCGANAVLPAPAVMAALKDRGIVVEPMTTGAACRTYNVLLAEGRRVAALLIPG
ncbi:MAG: hypothetical protein GC185_03355 [Alphaproteobacteria bacterium]|nr:hypothetical protein [Alphaproteobacteria bacterium]